MAMWRRKDLWMTTEAKRIFWNFFNLKSELNESNESAREEDTCGLEEEEEAGDGEGDVW
jgi:hypothetical protein